MIAKNHIFKFWKFLIFNSYFWGFSSDNLLILLILGFYTAKIDFRTNSFRTHLLWECHCIAMLCFEILKNSKFEWIIAWNCYYTKLIFIFTAKNYYYYLLLLLLYYVFFYMFINYYCDSSLFIYVHTWNCYRRRKCYYVDADTIFGNKSK